jgi:hypothetical protein
MSNEHEFKEGVKWALTSRTMIGTKHHDRIAEELWQERHDVHTGDNGHSGE